MRTTEGLILLASMVFAAVILSITFWPSTPEKKAPIKSSPVGHILADATPGSGSGVAGLPTTLVGEPTDEPRSVEKKPVSVEIRPITPKTTVPEPKKETPPTTKPVEKNPAKPPAATPPTVVRKRPTPTTPSTTLPEPRASEPTPEPAPTRTPTRSGEARTVTVRGEDVLLELLENVSPERASIGDLVRLRVVKAVVVDGITVVEAGAAAQASVTDKTWSATGRTFLEITLRQVATAGGGWIPIKFPPISRSGSSSNPVEFPRGTRIEARLRSMTLTLYP